MQWWDENACFEAGHQAALKGIHMNENPFQGDIWNEEPLINQNQYVQWERGWDTGLIEKLKRIEQGLINERPHSTQ